MTPHRALRQQAAEAATTGAWNPTDIDYAVADAVLRVALDAATASIKALQAPYCASDLDHGYIQARTDVLVALDALLCSAHG